VQETVVLTAGTFLSGLIHIGQTNYQAGRAGDPPANRLAHRLRELSLPAGRLKTVRRPVLIGRSIDYSGHAKTGRDDPVPVFSFMGNAAQHPNSCLLDYRDQSTHARYHSWRARPDHLCLPE